MRQGGSRNLLLVIMLGLTGLLGGAWWTRHSAPRAGTPLADRAILSEQVVRFESQLTAASEDCAASTDAFLAPSVAAVAIGSLTPDAAAQFAVLCRVRLLAADTDLDLSHREWAGLAAAFAHCQTVRLAYEAEIASVETVAPAHFRVEIPTYGLAGEELRRRFVSDLAAALGESVAAEVIDKLGHRLEAEFAGFGVSRQTLEVFGEPVAGGEGMTIHRTARYWTRVNEHERMTTRLHVEHLSALDAGDRWDVLVALIGKAG